MKDEVGPQQQEPFLASARNGYQWYTNKCMPDILLGKNVLLLAKDKDNIIGLGIGKKDLEETKLRCIRVSTGYSNRGIGIRLTDRMLRLLNKDKPHCTVPEEMLHGFSRPFVNEFKFDLSHITKGEYRKGKLEYHFNRR